MKKLLSVTLAISFIFSAFWGVSAENLTPMLANIELPTGGRLAVAERDDALSNIEPVRKRGVQKPVKEYLEEQLLAHANEIYLYNYGLPDNEDSENMILGVIKSNYQIMAYSKYWYGVDDNTGIITGIEPLYKFDTVEEDEEAREFMRNKIEKDYLEKVENIPNDDVLGKILVIHDLFCANNTYAQEELDKLKNREEQSLDIYTAYGLFTNNRAVCQGNSIALKAIYDALNEQLKESEADEDIIKTGLCESKEMNHIWNVIKIDGKWYHLDETGDDPRKYDTGYARHEYFLRSEGQMSDHTGDWIYYADEEVECSDTKYEGDYIFNSVDGRLYSDFGQLITYEGGRYRMEIEYIGEERPFWSTNLKATKLLATDPYDEEINGVKYKTVKFFSMGEIDMSEYCVSYSINGSMSRFSRTDMSKGSLFFNIKHYVSSTPRRVLIWEKGGFEPLCRAIDIPADTD